MTTVGWLVVALALAVPGAAQATCAWVLWEKTEWTTFREKKGLDVQTAWKVMGAHERRDACMALRNAMVKLKAHECDGDKCPGVLKVESLADSAVYMKFKPAKDETSSSAMFSYDCLPDTVDPRPR
jgi:hypothetical protein